MRDLRPLKSETYRVWMTVGGDKLEYYSDPKSPTVSLLNTKIFLNSVISDAREGTQFATADIKITIFIVRCQITNTCAFP